jgi:hypothetical protein
MAYNFVRSYIDTFRERTAAISHTSTFRSTGQITPEEFVLAGDFLVFKFPSWEWADASSPSKRVPYLPEGKQFLVTRGVPCNRRLDDNFAGEAGQDETMVRDGFAAGEGEADDDGWLRTGGMGASQEAKVRDVRTVDESGNLGAAEDEDEIPDMEDEDDDEEAIIREPHGGSNTSAYVFFADQYHGHGRKLTSEQTSPNIYPLHLLFSTLSNTSLVPLWLRIVVGAAEASGNDGGHCWRLQRQDRHHRRLPIF